ncbi:hypothetical protein Gotri_011214 [Gossypium trilobum]|uniref:Transcription and mRNA export factor ENY2 n=1 Tax=Gossypium trilobum TaxID=34281 RepID=A0A7J9ETJ2_9ROSI|nr:hypothetical protein [Gossypium trilobum]
MSRPPPPPPTTNKDQQHQNPSLQEINIKVFGKKSAMQLIQSGEKERLKELLRERLLECGWIDEMKALCRFFLLFIYNYFYELLSLLLLG